MKLFKWEELQQNPLLFQENFNSKLGTALTVGSFDGPHLGHDSLFNAVIQFSLKHKVSSGIITFLRPPKVSESVYSGDVSSLAIKLDKFKEKGFDFVVLIDFSSDFGTIAGDTFIDFLVNSIHMKYLAVGSDFRCGYRQDTGVIEIKQMALKKGFCFDSIGQIKVDGVRISSSSIRDAIKIADFSQAKKLLGYSYLLDLSLTKLVYIADGVSAACNSFTQVLPPVGTYHAILHTSYSSNVIVDVHISQETVLILPKRIDTLINSKDVKTLEFISIR